MEKREGMHFYKYEKLKNLLQGMEKVLVAFSGGVDSSFLLKVARDVLGDGVLAVIAGSETYPEKEKEEAIQLAQRMGVKHRVIYTHELENPDFAQNPPQRCYFCKTELFGRLKEIADEEGISHVLDGSNFEDLEDFRPGTEAGKELGIRSPLREAGLVKSEIRELSRSLGLPTWNKPSLACLSSRFPYYTEIDRQGLRQVEQAEEFLREIGFTQVRVRHHGQIARIEVEPREMPRFLEKNLREKALDRFKKIGYSYITLDLAGYRTGSMNEPLKNPALKP